MCLDLDSAAIDFTTAGMYVCATRRVLLMYAHPYTISLSIRVRIIWPLLCADRTSQSFFHGGKSLCLGVALSTVHCSQISDVLNTH